MNMKLLLASFAVSTGLCAGAMAQVTGKVTLDGKAPEMAEIDMSTVKECAAQHADPVHKETIVANDKGELANVIVSVKKEEGVDLPGDIPKTPAELTQHGCQYVPHVLPAMVGQAILIKNDDTFLHNVHSQSTANPSFNFGQPNKDDGKKVDPFKAVETFSVKCDVHPWMQAWVRVFDHPYFATTGADGTFSIAGLPDGDYTFVAWQEELKEVEAKGTVKGGKATVNFTFKAADAAAPANKDFKEIVVKASTISCPACDKPAETKVADKNTEKNADKNDKAIGPQAEAN